MPKSGLVRWHRGAGWLSLWPHWNTLWRVCARGHYAVHRKPLRPKPAGDGDDIEASMQRGLPSQEEGGYRLDLVREEGNDFSPYLHFPGPLAPRYPVNGYARTAEFQRMLEGLDLTRPLAQWKGRYFYAHVGIMENQEFNVNFCACGNGISFVFPMKHWKSIQNLFRRAWQSPDVMQAWDTLALEYGEM